MSVEEQKMKIEEELKEYCNNSFPEFCCGKQVNCDKCKINNLTNQLAVSLEKNRQLEREIIWFKSHTTKVDEYNFDKIIQ